MTSSGSWDNNSTNSQSPGFSFNNSFMSDSLSDLLPAADVVIRGGLSNRIAKFKSFPPPSLPLSPPLVSPSSYFSIPAGLSPAEFLDSPVLLPSSHALQSPTTGTFPYNAFDWKANSISNSINLKQENTNYSDFSFQPQAMPPIPEQQQQWGYNEYESPNENKIIIKLDFSPEMVTTQGNNCVQPTRSIREQKRSEDGYNWRKYGQKQVKGSENPRSYYKCTHPTCPTKKKVEKTLDGEITEIVYKGNHNHDKPQSTRRNSSSCQAIQAYNSTSEHNGHMESVGTPENSSLSVGDEDFDRTSGRSRSVGDDIDENEPDAKRWKRESEGEGISQGSRTVREPRVVVQTTSEIDILDDGYRWRKYGQKVVKGNPNPRSYYKCTTAGCPVRKHVERASHDMHAVITTYEGKHNHDVPAARGSANHAINRPHPASTNINSGMAIRPSIRPHPSNMPLMNPIRSYRQDPTDPQVPFTLEMLQSPANFVYSGFDDPIGTYMNQPQPQQQQIQHQQQNNVFSTTKEEPRDDMYYKSLFC